MSVFQRVTVSTLKKNKIRTIVTIIGVILSAAMIMAITTFTSSIQNFMVDIIQSEEGEWHVQGYDTTLQKLNELKDNDDIQSFAAAENVGYAKVTDSYGTWLVNILGFSEDTYELAPITVVSGRLPQTGDEIVLETSFADGRYEVGDKVTLSVGDRYLNGKKLYQCDELTVNYDDESIEISEWVEKLKVKDEKSYTVVGIIGRPGFESYGAPGYSAITAASGTTEDYRTFVKLENPKNVYDFTEDAFDGMRTRIHSELLRYMGISDDYEFNASLYAMGGMLILIVVLGSISLIYNAFSTSVSERTKQFGLLSSVGATRKQIRKMVIFEGLIICAVGIPIGVLCGIAGAGIVLKVLGPSFSAIINTSTPIEVTMHVSLAAVVTAVIISLVTVMVSAFLPALRASRVTPIEAIRQTNDIKVRKCSKKLKVSWIVRKLFGIEGIVASKNFKNNKRKYRSTVISLTFSIVLFVAASCFTEYLNKMSDIAISDYGYDIMWMSNSSDESDNMQMYEKLKSAQEVTDSGYIAYIGIEVDVDAARVNDPDADSMSGNGKYYSIAGYINFIDDDSFREFAESEGLNPDDYFDSKKLNAICYDQRNYQTEDGKYATELTFNNRDKALEVKTGSGFGNITIDYFSGSTPKYSVYYGSGFDIIMPYGSLSKFDVKGMCETCMLFNSPDYQKTSEEMNKILEDNGLYGDSVYSVAQQEAMNRALIKIINVFSFGFIALISLISVVNVFNTISTNIHLRRREFAMLRSIGMTDGGFNKIMIIECIFYGIKSVVYGVTLSTLAAYLIFKMTEPGFELSFTFPWKSMLVAVGSVFLVVIITMIYAMRKVKKQNTIEAIKDDNI